MKSTILRYLIRKSPDELCEAVGALPFKIEIKSILKDGKNHVCYFTLVDGQEKITNEMLKALSNG